VALTVGIVAVNREKIRTAQEQKRTQEALEAEAEARRQTDVALGAESRARQRARDALDQMSSQVIENWLSRQKAKLEPAQEEFLQKRVTYYQEYAAESADREEVGNGVAAAHMRVGRTRSILGQTGEAAAAFREALRLYGQLAADFPAKPEYRRELAGCHHNL